MAIVGWTATRRTGETTSVPLGAASVDVHSVLANADVAALHPRTRMMRLPPDVPLQGPAIIRAETAHQLAVERRREAMALRLDHEGVPCADRPGGALQGRRQLIDGARQV